MFPFADVIMIYSSCAMTTQTNAVKVKTTINCGEYAFPIMLRPYSMRNIRIFNRGILSKRAPARKLYTNLKIRYHKSIYNLKRQQKIRLGILQTTWKLISTIGVNLYVTFPVRNSPPCFLANNYIQGANSVISFWRIPTNSSAGMQFVIQNVHDCTCPEMNFNFRVPSHCWKI